MVYVYASKQIYGSDSVTLVFNWWEKKKKKKNWPMQIRIYKISPNIVSNCFNDLQHGWPRKRGP